MPHLQESTKNPISSIYSQLRSDLSKSRSLSGQNKIFSKLVNNFKCFLLPKKHSLGLDVCTIRLRAATLRESEELSIIPLTPATHSLHKSPTRQ